MDSNSFKGVKGLHLTHLNIRSLFAHYDLFSHYLKNSGIACATLSETWLNDKIPTSLLNIEGYTLIRLDRMSQTVSKQTIKGGGVAVYIHNAFDYSETELAHLNLSDKNIEIQWLTITKPFMKKVIVANVYRPPKGDVGVFIDYITYCYEQLQNHVKNELFIMGDFNIDWIKQNEPKSKAIKQLIKQIGCKQFISTPTHFNRRTTDSLIDFAISNSDKIIEAGTKDLNISDHELIYVTRRHTKKLKENLTFIGRSYRQYSKEQFTQALFNTNWDHLWTYTDPEQAWQYFIHKLDTTLSSICPVKQFKFNRKKQPWLNRYLLEALFEKDRMLHRAKVTNTEDDWNIARFLRNRAKLLVRQAKQDYFKDQLELNKSNPSNFWRVISYVTNSKTKSKSNISLIDQNTGNKVAEQDTANFINYYFANIGPNLAANLNEPWSYTGITMTEAFDLKVFTQEEVIKIIKNIDTSKSSGVQYFSTSVLKDAFLVLPYHLTFIMNLSIRNKIVPISWKNAKIIPIPKEGNLSDVNNFRPISLLPLPGKILERLVYLQAISYLETNSLLTPKQGGFRAKHSTVGSMADFSDIIYNYTNEGKTTKAIFIDFRKAFDTINHQILLNKLTKIGLKTNTIDWFKNYLTDRTQQTLANGVLSNPIRVTCGVPQGSILGPLLFIIYINDIGTCLNYADLQLYADDTVLYIPDPMNTGDTTDFLNSDLKRLAKWCAGNKLTINTKKTKAMNFATKGTLKKYIHKPILLNNEVIELTTSYKYLGLTFDCNLTFKKHISNLINIINRKAYLLSKLRHHLTKAACITLFKSMILPHFDYGDIIYSAASLNQLTKLQRIQNNCLRICFRADLPLSVDELHRAACLNLLTKRREHHLLNFAYIRTLHPNLTDNRLINTRAHNLPLLKVTRPNCTQFTKSVDFKSATLWNAQSNHLRAIRDHANFKNSTRKMYRDQIYA